LKSRSKCKSLEECIALFEIEVSLETLEKAFADVYGEISKYANIAGFRVGKAPLDLVKKQYGEHAREEVLKRLIPDAYHEAITEHKIHPVGYPEISDVAFDGGKPLSFKAKVETRPEFKIKDYKGIKIEKKKAAVKDADIDTALDNLRQLNAKYISVEDRPLQHDDYAVVDLECTVDGNPIHKKRDNLWMFMDKDSLLADLHAKMIGMRKDEERDIDVTLPERYPDKKVAGKTVRYHIKVKEIKLRQMAALDDEFAKDLHKESLEGLKKEVREELERRTKAAVEADAENQLLAKLADGYDFAVPSSMVKRQLEFMVDDAKKRLEEKGFPKEELDKKQKEFEDKFKADALRRVRLLFVLDLVASAENIDAADKDVEEIYRQAALQTGQEESKIKEYYEKEGLVGDLKEKLREEKTIRFLLDNAKVTEKE